MKKKNAIMIADTRPALIGHLLLQIKETNSNLFDIALIYYEKISEKDKKIMEKIMPCKFIKYDYKFSTEVLELPAFKKFSCLMFSRYEMFDLLNEYETITWIDTDVLICGDLSPIVNNAKAFGFVANFENEIDKSYKYVDYVRTSFRDGYQSQNYDLTKYNMSSGIISVGDHIKSNKSLTKWCYDKTIEYSKDLVLPDQGILNLLVQEFNIDVCPAGENGAYCVYPYNGRNVDNAKIIHSWGSRKFWNNWYLFLKFPRWNNLYQKWLNMGGSCLINGEIKPQITVLMPIFKPNFEFLKESLDSILCNQVDLDNYNFDSVELLLLVEPVNIEEIKKFINDYSDPRIHLIINPERFGIAKSLNIGIKNAKADYIARMDDDDISCPKRFFLQFRYLKEHQDCELVTSYYEYFGSLNEKRKSFSGDLVKAWDIFTCPFDHPTIMFKKDFFINNNLFYDETRKFVEDWELWNRAFSVGLNVGCVNQILFKHRMYKGSASTNDQSIKMMQELTYNNFKKLNVNIPANVLPYVSPWMGQVSNDKIFIVQKIFNQALDNNQELNIYNQNSLKKVFEIKLKEMKTGRIDDLLFNSKNEKKSSLFKRVIKFIFKPFYYSYKIRMERIIKDNIEPLQVQVKELSDKIDELTNIIKNRK
jgi:lipopolysaccharide biosynthesis glycosyltransferase